MMQFHTTMSTVAIGIIVENLLTAKKKKKKKKKKKNSTINPINKSTVVIASDRNAVTSRSTRAHKSRLSQQILDKERVTMRYDLLCAICRGMIGSDKIRYDNPDSPHDEDQDYNRGRIVVIVKALLYFHDRDVRHRAYDISFLCLTA